MMDPQGPRPLLNPSCSRATGLVLRNDLVFFLPRRKLIFKGKIDILSPSWLVWLKMDVSIKFLSRRPVLTFTSNMSKRVRLLRYCILDILKANFRALLLGLLECLPALKVYKHHFVIKQRFVQLETEMIDIFSMSLFLKKYRGLIELLQVRYPFNGVTKNWMF